MSRDFEITKMNVNRNNAVFCGRYQYLLD